MHPDSKKGMLNGIRAYKTHIEAIEDEIKRLQERKKHLQKKMREEVAFWKKQDKKGL